MKSDLYSRVLRLFLFLLLLIPLHIAEADERILSFHSDITVHKDASMSVRETIVARSEGVDIKRGIYRDFPTTYKDPVGNRYKVKFEVTGVTRNGNTEPYHIESMHNGKRVYIGSQNVFLDPGDYTYTLSYKTDRQLGFFKDFDELYWNVTGNGWKFPIDSASAAVELPDDATGKIVSISAYTGPQGSTEKSFHSSVDSSGKVNFSAKRPLNSNEGFTIAVSWPKGYVAEPDSQTKMRYYVSENRGTIIGFIGITLLFLYYLIIWLIVGKDPESGVIVTRYSPPDNMTPAVMRFIKKMGFDNKVFASAIINMAVKGFLTIKESDDGYVLNKKAEGKTPLSPGEEKIIAKLFGSDSSMTLKTENHKKIRAAIQDLKDYLKLKFEKIYFLSNKTYFILGLIFSIFFLFSTGLWSAIEQGDLFIFFFMCVWLSIWSLGAIVLVAQVISRWKNAFYSHQRRFVNIGGAMFLTIFSLPFIGGEIVGITVMIQATSIQTLIFLLTAVFINYLFYHLLKAPTRAGRRTLDAIEGFRVFLSATAKDRMNLLNSPERTPELFEKYLPYALALDVEQEWSEQFSDILEAATAGTERGYSPAWYAGTSLYALNAADFASSFGNSFSNAISSSSTAPGSSSGSGGGGSSGGGGGGGGGGGW